MDVYDFTQALRRQRRFLVIGGIVLMFVVFMLTFEVSGSGLEPRIAPQYTASVRMVVAPADSDALSTAPLLGGDVIDETALFFQTLLLAPDTTMEIEEATGTDIQGLTVVAEGPTITATTVAASPEGAAATALGSFEWLTDELKEPLALFDVTPVEDAPSLLDSEGRLTTSVALTASPAFAVEGNGLWIDVLSDGAPIKTMSLADAGIGGGAATTVAVRPGGELVLRLSDVAQNELDQVQLAIPALPGSDSVPYTLSLRIDRGAVVGIPTPSEAGTVSDVSDASLVADRIEVAWQPADIAGEAQAQAEPGIGLILLTDNPIPQLTGTRRGPIITMGALFGGAFALIALALAVDSWKEAHRNRASNRSRERLAIIRPITTEHSRRYLSSGPLSHLVTTERDRLPAIGDEGATDATEPGVITRAAPPANS